MADTLAVPVELSALLGADERVHAVIAGAGQPVLLVTDFRILSSDTQIPLSEVVSVATSGNSLSGGSLSIRSEDGELRITGVPFDQAQRFAAAVRGGLARVQAAVWMPTQRGPVSNP
ncbi:hypothetical protein GCM10010174_12940 [Kutzneria viridogrisea]|uniref:YokE-like PH domain-containing protein n=2 Tax=Kutzneria TaxID=43356 RepID=W5WKL3_9PSEU|nr:hypothetical protein [Kutzneria albida]AHI01102.1 hypothetical protein KALB_7744 [Kutzneria albida DSM 43870]MBA8926357.1 hypothetical protein [Kutzneria viridogrisea]